MVRVALKRWSHAGAPLANVRHELAGSTANGPGSRYVVWFQGCPHGCKGCYNPETWADIDAGLVEPNDLAERILSSGCDGVTFSGGEPMSQPEALLAVLECLHPAGGLDARLPLGVLVFTGHEVEEIEASPECSACLPYIDVAVSGRYVRELRAVHGLLGSTNQRLLWNERPGRGRELLDESALTIGQFFEGRVVKGGVLLTGFPDIATLGVRGLKVHGKQNNGV
ncbi:MAG: radical SAM protein [Armatimonadetes bacterium]|nr:radical SAM protein [Armatimonadota bacterium]